MKNNAKTFHGNLKQNFSQSHPSLSGVSKNKYISVGPYCRLIPPLQKCQKKYWFFFFINFISPQNYLLDFSYQISSRHFWTCRRALNTQIWFESEYSERKLQQHSINIIVVDIRTTFYFMFKSEKVCVLIGNLHFQLKPWLEVIFLEKMKPPGSVRRSLNYLLNTTSLNLHWRSLSCLKATKKFIIGNRKKYSIASFIKSDFTKQYWCNWLDVAVFHSTAS